MARIYNLQHERVEGARQFKLTIGAAPLPTSVDLSGKFPDVYDQGTLGSCTSNAIVGALQSLGEPFLSRLKHYYDERKGDGDVKNDAGSTLSRGISVAENQGICVEELWPYDVTKFAVCPPAAAYEDALKRKVMQAHQVPQDEVSMKTCLAGGNAIVLGINVYPGLESDQAATTGMVPMPGPKDQLLGGHAIVCVGYDDATRLWKMRNSWGKSWGASGYFFLPYEYLESKNLCSDIWTITKIAPVVPLPLPPAPPAPAHGGKVAPKPKPKKQPKKKDDAKKKKKPKKEPSKAPVEKKKKKKTGH